MRWLRRWRGHRHPVPEGMFRLVLLTDDLFPTYIGTRAWCDGKKRPCCGGRCCECTHTERRAQ